MTSELLFCGLELGGRIEAAEADLIKTATEAAGQRGADAVVLPLAGGCACVADPASPANKVVGLGFGGVPDGQAWDELDRLNRERGPIPVELSNLADPAVAAALAERGFTLLAFENVLGQSLAGLPNALLPNGVEIRPSTPDEFEAWIDVVVEGFAHPNDVGVPSHEEFPRDIVATAVGDFAKAGSVSYLALCDGHVAGGGSIRMTDGVAQLTGAATAPQFRRRGVQAALLQTRLADAAAAGCDIAVVTTAPGSASQKNVQRKGFQLLYTRAVLVKS